MTRIKFEMKFGLAMFEIKVEMYYCYFFRELLGGSRLLRERG